MIVSFANSLGIVDVIFASDLILCCSYQALCWPKRLMDGDSYIVICSAGSGEEVAKLDSDDFAALVEGHGTSSGRALKKFLAHRLQISRFRQRLLNQDTGELLQDDMILSPAMNIQLVKLEFLPSDDRREEEFRDACEEGLLDEVERILQGPQDPNDPHLPFNYFGENFDGDYMPLDLAAAEGHLEVVRLLLESGADKDYTSRGGITALHSAAANGRLEVVRLLLDSGSDKEKLAYGLTALHSAAMNGHSEVVRLLLESGADKHTISHGGTTALHFAVENGHLEVVRLLLDSGADKEKLSNGRTALHSAAMNGHSEVVRLLLESGADKEKLAYGLTALHGAAMNGHSEVVRLLLESGADKEKLSNGLTALHSAAMNGHSEVVRLLLESGADKERLGASCKTALQLAAENNHYDVVHLLQISHLSRGSGSFHKIDATRVMYSM